MTKSPVGEKSLAWLKENVPQFARAAAKVEQAKADEAANRAEMKVAAS